MGALPARNPFRWARSRNCSATFAVSCSTSATGIEISSSCLQPSTNANLGLPRREKNGTEIPEYQRFSAERMITPCLSVHVQGRRVEVGERYLCVQARDGNGCAGTHVFTEQPTVIVLVRGVLHDTPRLMHDK